MEALGTVVTVGAVGATGGVVLVKYFNTLPLVQNDFIVDDRVIMILLKQLCEMKYELTIS